MAETKRMATERVVGYLLEGEGIDFLRESLRWVVQQLMEAEVSELIGAERGARTSERLTHRNGYRARAWQTRAGEIELAIPKIRRGSYFPSFLEPRRRSEQALVSVVQEAYVAGVSTRKVDQVVESLGLRISKSEVSRICAGLDEQVDAFRNRPLEGRYPVGFVNSVMRICREIVNPAPRRGLRTESLREKTKGPALRGLSSSGGRMWTDIYNRERLSSHRASTALIAERSRVRITVASNLERSAAADRVSECGLNRRERRDQRIDAHLRDPRAVGLVWEAFVQLAQPQSCALRERLHGHRNRCMQSDPLRGPGSDPAESHDVRHQVRVVVDKAGERLVRRLPKEGRRMPYRMPARERIDAA
jgi:hypothetical protein